jgi:hypothetical protein
MLIVTFISMSFDLPVVATAFVTSSLYLDL